MVSVRSPEMLVVAIVALTLFAICSFWIVRIAHRIQGALESRHPDILQRLKPDPSAHWTVQWSSQGPVAVAWAFLPIAYGLDDKPLEDDVAHFKAVAVASVVTLLVSAVSIHLALAQ